MRRNPVAAIVAVAGLCLLVAGVARSAESNVYWRADLHQGTSIIAYGQGFTAEAALQDCYRLQAITRAMTATETRKGAVAAITASAVRWCNNQRRYSTVSPDPVAPIAVNCVVSAWSTWSDPPWLACADGFQSRTRVRNRTIITQPANGGTACPTLIETQPETRVCQGAAILSWTHDGLNTTEYRVTYWRDGLLPSVRTIPGNTARRQVMDNLQSGLWYFNVSAAICPTDPSRICNVSNPSETDSKVVL